MLAVSTGSGFIGGRYFGAPFRGDWEGFNYQKKNSPKNGEGETNPYLPLNFILWGGGGENSRNQRSGAGGPDRPR
ncbi:hypothetical protein CH642_27730 [Salmonella enterica subsp. enterica serovar Heidelberg]|nr:hypothetical protein CH642_27730 [Salmonella enterica subsp. enterica serovar Heidelberg]